MRIFLNADSNEKAAVFSYEFDFKGQKILYEYARFSDLELQWEKLFIDDKKIFDCDFSLKRFDFSNLKHIDAETANIDRYTQSLEEGEETEDIIEPKLPFLRWLFSNVALKNDSILIKLSNYVRRMIVISAGNVMKFRPRRLYDGFFETLANEKKLKDLEDFFNSMGIECRLILKNCRMANANYIFLMKNLFHFLKQLLAVHWHYLICIVD